MIIYKDYQSSINKEHNYGEKMKHLEMILDVVNRMASNSFALKGWAITLVAGIFALQGNGHTARYLIKFLWQLSPDSLF